MLKHFYSLEQSPSHKRMHEIAEKVGLSYSQVYKWFWEQNRKTTTNSKYFSSSLNKNQVREKQVPLMPTEEKELPDLFLCCEIVLPKGDPLSLKAAQHIRYISLKYFKCLGS